MDFTPSVFTFVTFATTGACGGAAFAVALHVATHYLGWWSVFVAGVVVSAVALHLLVKYNLRMTDLTRREVALAVREICFVLMTNANGPTKSRISAINFKEDSCVICHGALVSDADSPSFIEGCRDCKAVCHTECMQTYVCTSLNDAGAHLDDVKCILCRRPYFLRRWVVDARTTPSGT